MKTMLNFVDCKIEPVGELAERLALNLARLSGPYYRPESIYSMDQAGWPGDWEGRTILALVSLWNALGTKPAYLDPIMEDLPRHLNAKGYLGPVNEKTYDEQQLSGHNWLVRGLCEYWLRTGDGEVRKNIESIVRGLYLPLLGQYSTYPVDPALRSGTGEFAGTISSEAGQWKLSSDIGCAFMCLDALSQVYQLFRFPEVLRLLDEMIEVFTSIEFVATRMQTHATLSATRGILRLAETFFEEDPKKSAKYCDAAKRIYDIYIRSGMTENFANFNWFGRTDSWTEPCAIVDSMMAALSLFRLTGEVSYLTLANRIWYNALGYAQRPNGGFGLDKCVGPAGDVLEPCGDGITEAYWCCTMRGSEGLRARAMHSVLTGVDDSGREVVWLPFTTDVNISCPKFSAVVRSGLPEAGWYRVDFKANEPFCGTVMIYTPAGIDRYELELAPGEQMTLENRFELPLTRVRTADGKRFKNMRGDLILAQKASVDSDGNAFGEALSPLTDMRMLSMDEAGRDKRKVLFS